tara:strand:- start:5472 stop:7574 length:2103 start_codon:yes stop_codon:yes gene_type:complete
MADNRSIFEQMAGTLGSQYGQTYGILSRDRKKRERKERRKAILGSILFNTLSESSKYLKNNLTNQIADLKDRATWDENYTKELWRQGSEIKAEEAAVSKNPSYFYKMAADNIMNSPYGVDIARAGGVQNLTPTAYQAYQDLVKAREAEYIANHNERMANPTASFATFKEFSQGDRDMLTLQANNLRDDLSNRNLFFAALKKLGVGKDKEIEFNAELGRMRTEQEERYAAAEAYVAPLNVTRFIDYDVANKEQIFTLSSSLDLRKSDEEKTRIRKEMADPKNGTWNNITFNNDYGIYDINNIPLSNLSESNTKRFSGNPLKQSELKKMELMVRAGVDKNGNLMFKKDSDIQGPVPYLIDDIYALERRQHAIQTAEVKRGDRETVDNLEKRYAIAVQQLVNNGNIRIDRNGFNNYVYIPLNKNMSPTDLVNSKNPNNTSNKLDTLASVHNKTEVENAEDLSMAYDNYLNNKIDAADVSGNINDLESLEAIKVVNSKAAEEDKLMFIINPPAELSGTMFSYLDGEGNKQGLVIGSQDKENYKVLYNQFKDAYGPSDTIEELLDLEDSEVSTDEDTTQVPESVIRDDLKPKTTSDIYYKNESDRAPASLLAQSIVNRPVKTITDIDEVLDKIDTVDSVKDLKNFKAKIIKGIKDSYKEDTGERLVNVNNLSLDDYKKYLTMYRSSFIQDNRDLFQQPTSLLAGN